MPSLASVSLHLAVLALATALHYENPFTQDGCGSDELAIQIQGVPGAICSPSCNGGVCPKDVPANVTAAPQCALKDQTGKQYCALICIPEGPNTCGPGAACRPLPPMGLCTYDPVREFHGGNYTGTKLLQG